METEDITNLTFQEFIDKLAEPEDKYHEYLSTMKNGYKIVLKREPSEIWINNYNEEMLRAWNANMDIQIAYDPHAVVTYICNYVNKPEEGMTKFLREALNAAKDKEHEEQLRILNFTYLTHRQRGGPEALYCMMKNMALRQSNRACRFVIAGFPENRSLMWDPVQEKGEKVGKALVTDDSLEENPDDEGTTEDFFTDQKSKNVYEIANKEGKWQPRITVIDQYVARPECLSQLTYIQFVISYEKNGKPKVNDELALNTDKVLEENILSEDWFNHLPKWIKLNDNLGYLKRRGNHPFIPRIHVCSKKEGYESYYAEMMLHTSWRDEEKEFHPSNPVECERAYTERFQKLP